MYQSQVQGWNIREDCEVCSTKSLEKCESRIQSILEEILQKFDVRMEYLRPEMNTDQIMIIVYVFDSLVC